MMFKHIFVKVWTIIELAIVNRTQSTTDLKRLLLQSGRICAFPGCGRGLVTPDSDFEKGAIIAEMAHIVADSREGPRGNVPMSEAQRGSHENQIVLCPGHHKIVDSQPQTYSVQVLRQMKADHLAAIRRKLGAGQGVHFTATVGNSNNSGVNWSISPAGVGSISSGGLYTAPSSISTQQSVTISATSQADPTVAASVTVNLVACQGGSNGYAH